MSSNKKVSIALVVIVVLSLFSIYSSYAIFKSKSLGTKEISIASFNIKLNGKSDLSQVIDLKDTITSNQYSDEYVIPGTTGKIDLTLDFSDVDVSVNYEIILDEYDLPTNLKLYSDSSYKNEFTNINGTYLINGEKTNTHSIYWKWEYKTEEDNNTNDNSYMNKKLSVPVVVVASQKVGGGN